jgi:iron complex transport system substrate-binding protein
MQKNFLFFFLLISVFSCKQKTENILISTSNDVKNTIKHAHVFQLKKYKNYKVLSIKNPFQKGSHTYKYILKQPEAAVPDSLRKYKQIQVPIQSIIVTSTTHIPALELLNEETKLVGFPSTNYISSPKTRALIDSGKIKELNNNQALNVETILSLKPDVLVAFGINGLSKPLQNLERMQIPVLVNGDWLEETALGKAEWIKFFGALFNKEKQADSIFNTIEANYNKAKLLAQQSKTKPIVFAGALQGDKWVMPAGKSWVAQFLKDANSNYLWAGNQEKGSLKLNYENVLVKAKDADFWLAPGFYDSKDKLAENKHYQQFKAFQNNAIYSFTTKKGTTGGLIYFELAPQRPDWVLKDLIHIFHPELLNDYENHFFEKLP